MIELFWVLVRAGLAQPVAQIALPVALFFSLARSAKKIDLVKTRLPKFCPGGLNSGKRKIKCESFQNVVGSVFAFRGILDKNRWFKYQKNRLRRFVSINYDQEFVEIGVIGTKLKLTCYCCNKKNKKRERKEKK